MSSIDTIIDKKRLERILEEIPGFKRPDKRFEQYITPSRIVSEIILKALLRKELSGSVADLGCGTGRIALAASLAGAERVFCIDISCRDLETANEIFKKYDLSDSIDIICWDLAREIKLRVDTVIMNPPFGVYRRGYDMLFLERAWEISDNAIYSIHKYNKRSIELIRSRALERSFEARVESVTDMEIPALFETHRRRIYRFKVVILYMKRKYS
ncbi:MAG: METTL5 family protein [Sulfolobales archaeon]